MQSPEMRLNIIEKNESSVYETVCYLAQLGHKRIGGIFCIDEIDDSFLMARKRGFLKAISQINLDQDESLIGQLHGECEKRQCDFCDRKDICTSKAANGIVLL